MRRFHNNPSPNPNPTPDPKLSPQKNNCACDGENKICDNSGKCGLSNFGSCVQLEVSHHFFQNVLLDNVKVYVDLVLGNWNE